MNRLGTFISAKRQPGEDFKQYKARLKHVTKNLKQRVRGFVVHDSSNGSTLKIYSKA